MEHTDAQLSRIRRRLIRENVRVRNLFTLLQHRSPQQPPPEIIRHVDTAPDLGRLRSFGPLRELQQAPTAILFLRENCVFSVPGLNTASRAGSFVRRLRADSAPVRRRVLTSVEMGAMVLRLSMIRYREIGVIRLPRNSGRNEINHPQLSVSQTREHVMESFTITSSSRIRRGEEERALLQIANIPGESIERRSVYITDELPELG